MRSNVKAFLFLTSSVLASSKSVGCARSAAARLRMFSPDRISSQASLAVNNARPRWRNDRNKRDILKPRSGSAPRIDVVAIGLENVLLQAEGTALGEMYKGLDFSMRRATLPYYVLTQFPKEKASSSLQKAADYFSDFTESSPRLKFGEKLLSLQSIAEKMPESSKLHYVDGDLETLEAVASSDLNIDLYYAAWSNPEIDPESVLKKGDGRIAVLQKDEFAGTMQWGFGLGDQLWDTYLISNDGAPMEPKGKI
mmetsp:Transcript_17736/g.26569  ORF Transcript_17736/g.26569 Transcript_17736/m.26569 type:complete len:253 (-) Transcript_17736:137-895(-)